MKTLVKDKNQKEEFIEIDVDKDSLNEDDND